MGWVEVAVDGVAGERSDGESRGGGMRGWEGGVVGVDGERWGDRWWMEGDMEEKRMEEGSWKGWKGDEDPWL